MDSSFMTESTATYASGSTQQRVTTPRHRDIQSPPVDDPAEHTVEIPEIYLFENLNDDNWYVRIPLWAQTTFLIIAIGFTSILLLVSVSAVKVYNYSENLIKTRFSNMAGMTALQLERIFSADSSFAMLYLSNPDVIQIFRKASSHSLTLQDYFGFDSILPADTSSSSMWGINFYDTNFTSFYSYRHKGVGVTLPYSVDARFPKLMFPLSTPNLRGDTVRMLSESPTAVMSNFTFSQTTSGNASGNWSYGYSITHRIYDSTSLMHDNEYIVESTSDTLLGYITFVFHLPVTSGTGAVLNLTTYAGSSAGKSIQIVRERDVNFGPSRNNDTLKYYGTLNVDPGQFKYTFPINNANYSISEFPLLSNAVSQANSTYDDSSSAAIQTVDSGFYNTSDINNTIISPYLDADLIKKPSLEKIEWDEYGQQVIPDALRGGIGSRNKTNSTMALSNYSTSTSQSTSTSTTIPTTVVGSGDVIGKLASADLVTKVPKINKATVGYSYASVYNEKWLVFVQEAKNKAFSEIVHVRNLNIYVAAGVLGGVLLIVLPLSRWQTQGVYTIYKGMKPRPLFSDGDNESQKGVEDKDSTFKNPPPQPPILDPFNDGNEAVQMTDVSSSNHNTKDSKGDSTSPASTADSSSMSHSVNDENHKFIVPLPLPKLKRWYTDELDELVEEFNIMVEKLNNHYHHLEDQVRVRTREAQKAGELREEANVAKSEFIAIISHELRTPLNGIMGLTAVNTEETDVTKIRSGLETIIDSGEILMNLLNELLVLSKSLVGVDAAITDFTPKVLLEMLSDLFMSRASELSTNFSLGTVPSQLNNVELKGDVDHIVQICVNFMSNAMKFSEQNGNVSVIVHLRPFTDPLVTTAPYNGKLDKSNAVLEVLVTDSGTGISKQQLAKIFDLFVQGDNPLRKNHKGAGLGMALSKQLAEGIGGYVTVFSAKDVGSTVALRVPVYAFGLSPEEVLSYNGPILEFSVRDVYSTTSLNPGEVKLVQEASEALAAQQEAMSPVSPQPQQTRGRHGRHSSISSRVYPTKGRSNVTRLLRSQSLHHPHISHLTFNSTNSGSGSNSRTQSMDTSTSNPEIILGSIEAVSGTHANTSASSLLLLEGDTPHLKASNRISIFSPNSSSDKLDAVGQDRGAIDESVVSTPLSAKAPPFGTTADGTSAMEGVFHLSSTIANSVAPDGSLQNSPMRDGGQEGHSFRDTRVLVAEDNGLNQQIMVKMLNQLGVGTVDTADDGNMVVSMVEKSIIGGFHYNVIFMDLSMPGKSGIEATQIIRGTLGYPYPIVALTGFSDLQTRAACLEVNIEEVLTKPIMKNELIRVVNRYANVVGSIK